MIGTPTLAAEPERPQFGNARTDEVVVVRPGRGSGLQHLQRRAHLQLVDVADLERAGRRSELADDRGRPSILEAVEHGGLEAEQQADLLRDGLEDLFGSSVPGYESRDAAKRRLLGAQPPLLRLCAPLFGEIADDRHRLVRPARHHPGLFAAADPCDLELVLERGHVAAGERALDPRHHILGERPREHVLDVPPDQLLRRLNQLRAVIGADIEVGAVTCHANHHVGDRVEESAVPPLDELRGLECTLVREREAGRGADGVEQLLAQPQGAVVDEHPDGLSLVDDRSRDLDVAWLRQFERRVEAVEVAALVAPKAAETERRVAQSPSQRFLEIGRAVGVTQLQEQFAHGCSREPSLHERAEEDDGQRQRGEQAETEADQAGMRRQRGENEPDREEEQRDRAADPHRHQLTARRLRPGASAAEEHERDRERDSDCDRRLELLEAGRERGLRVDEREVRRMGGVVPGKRVEDNGDGLEREHVEIGSGHEQATARPEAAAGKSQERVHQDREDEVRRKHTRRVGRRAVCLVEHADQRRKADCGEEKTEASIRPRSQSDDAGADERQADDRAQ